MFGFTICYGFIEAIYVPSKLPKRSKHFYACFLKKHTTEPKYMYLTPLGDALHCMIQDEFESMAVSDWD